MTEKLDQALQSFNVAAMSVGLNIVLDTKKLLRPAPCLRELILGDSTSNRCLLLTLSLPDSYELKELNAPGGPEQLHKGRVEELFGSAPALLEKITGLSPKKP